MRLRSGVSDAVIPAKAGIQVLNHLFKRKLKDWIPAFAGMTMIIVCVPALHAAKPVFLGIDVLEEQNFEPLSGSHIALITNQTGLNRTMESTADILHHAKNLKLECILTPEHGFRGDVPHGTQINNSIDSQTGLPIYSLYGQTTAPTEEMLKGVDTIVFDIQDVGTRFYTYIATMGQALEVAAKMGLNFVVLDRPNPIRGDIVEGDVLDSDIHRMTGYFSVPVRHGLTIGEIAMWKNDTENLGAKLHVIPMTNWNRSMWFDETGLIFTPPSPNIKSIQTALLYSGIGNFEATNIAVGRGTSIPFEVFGAPWLNARAFCAYLRAENFPGFLFEVESFSPSEDLYKDQLCHGVHLIVTDRNNARPFDVFAASFLFIYEHYPQEFKPDWEEVRVVTGSNKLKEVAEKHLTWRELISEYRLSQTEFLQSVTPNYLYPSNSK